MYRIQTDDNQLSVYNHNLFFHKIIPSILLDDEVEIDLTLVETEITNHSEELHSYVIHYSNAAEKINLSIQMDTYKDGLIAYIKSNLPIDSFKNTRTFLSNCSIKLRVSNLDVSEGFMANYLFSKWWTRPQFGKHVSNLKPKTQSLLWKCNSEYHHLLPLTDDQNKTELSSDGEELIISICPYSGV